MRIAHVAPVIHPVPPATYGGTERVVADLASAQVDASHEVTLFGPADCSLPRVRQVGDFLSLSWHEKQGGPVPPGLPAVLEAQLLGDLLAHGGGHDVIHLHGSAHASAVAQKLGAPAFRTIHWRADEPDHLEHFRAFPQERIIAISHAQAGAVPATNLAGIVHHGMPADRYRQGDGSGGYLAFLGRMTDQKRPDRAIELARATGRHLQLAGPVDPGNPAYFDEVVRPALDDRIRHIGSVDDTGKQDLLGNAAALVFPIDWPEPFGLVMIEAMACGTPVIAWRRGSVPEVVEDGVTGIVVDSVTEAVHRMDEVVQLDRSAIRRQFEERFSAGRMASETLALYREACLSRSSNESSARSPSP
ncbi:glycosyltransferase family 4 protein [Alteriqipengyuania flavescens]|uniref:glycosyltransferase family 4 protein n=1 Tax=Alteriqipengyuania flavescens TaxID=3053610 RepID=UPI0025B616A5|nr:glycosyltransferase family 4 protein [Alteriqipengyuania flavescens]WJY17815.1 glycosyltransferase family 4 protein [Alteriqipengyuania flavescens]WJY23757.1 glycosyltransferase family 4 protein [Alteriqipengyuania flavescens]